jgi:heme/copper-type cytochrome/quinol oxidase subunit 2
VHGSAQQLEKIRGGGSVSRGSVEAPVEALRAHLNVLSLIARVVMVVVVVVVVNARRCERGRNVEGKKKKKKERRNINCVVT